MIGKIIADFFLAVHAKRSEAVSCFPGPDNKRIVQISGVEIGTVFIWVYLKRRAVFNIFECQMKRCRYLLLIFFDGGKGNVFVRFSGQDNGSPIFDNPVFF